MMFFDYGNAFLLEASRANADILNSNGDFKYPSYVQDIMGPLCFDYGFGPFRWVCTSNDPNDLNISDQIALDVLNKLLTEAPEEIKLQLNDNINWIKSARNNNMVVGSQARILYADAYGRTKIAQAFNDAILKGKISAPIVLGRDHHDVSGTDFHLEKHQIYMTALNLLVTWLYKMSLEIALEEQHGFQYITEVVLAGVKLLMVVLVWLLMVVKILKIN